MLGVLNGRLCLCSLLCRVLCGILRVLVMLCSELCGCFSLVVISECLKVLILVLRLCGLLVVLGRILLFRFRLRFRVKCLVVFCNLCMLFG